MVVIVPDITADAFTATDEDTVEPAVGDVTVTPVLVPETPKVRPADFSSCPAEFQD
jgi:hypothetical protein